MQQPDSKTTRIWENLKDCFQDSGVDYIPSSEMQTLPELFSARISRTPDKLAYSDYSEATG